MKFAIFLIIIAGIAVWFLISNFSATESDVIAKNGLHWHPVLTIKINGEVQEIPDNVGMVPREMPIHTHEKDGTIHLEFAGLVKKNDIKLGNFFEIWGKTLNKDCIFDKCSSAGGQMKMLVNGKENFEFENYLMQDKDKIEIIFEAKSAIVPSQTREITVAGTEFSFSPASITVKSGEKIKLTFKNEGTAPHNLAIDNLGISTKTIGGGQSDSIEFTAPLSGSFNVFCSVPSHKEAGMRGQFKVE